MTTLIGIVAGKGESSVVLASDLQGTSERVEDRGEVVLKRKEREEAQKIHVSNAGDLAVCMTGTNDGNYRNFLYDVTVSPQHREHPKVLNKNARTL